MPSAWGVSWGVSWGGSWGSLVPKEIAGTNRGRSTHYTRRMANEIATRPMSISAKRQTQTHGTRRNIQTSKR